MEILNNSETEKESQKKITVGFKCLPSLKLKLSEQAQKLDISLSEYVENIVINYQPKNKDSQEAIEVRQEPVKKTCFADLEARLTNIMEEQLSPVLVAIEEAKELLIGQEPVTSAEVQDESHEELKAANADLKSQLEAITGNEGLKALFEKYEGKKLEYQTASGDKKKIQVSSIADIITALVETISEQ